ncbi:hypothetical protein BMETH_334_0 [methanotrophic bacterial endosymbiont of Bathymodiolus sp.]|nr:hypothetical protein BMETH_334_0 [methanotrophic bacterial endosymbiont of Bathymodiolus sp.]
MVLFAYSYSPLMDIINLSLDVSCFIKPFHLKRGCKILPLFIYF